LTQEGQTFVGVWQDLATVGPQVTVARAGDYTVMVAIGQGLHSAVGGAFFIGAAIGAGTPSEPFAVGSSAIANQSMSIGTSVVLSNVAAASQIRMRYQNGLAGTATFAKRWMTITPRRVS
jgi:hypothetical protein